jgi:hypothetical protein
MKGYTQPEQRKMCHKIHKTRRQAGGLVQVFFFVSL